MRRLSIIDLPGGGQPMRDERSGLRIVFNGEIFNFQALRAAHPEETWRTRSDTEVVLRDWSRGRERAIANWNGMFAIAAWDARAQELTLIRDRLGVKPLYYYWDGNRFLFGSEIKAILASGLVPRRISQQAMWDYLTYRYVPPPATPWEGIFKLPPGHFLRIRRGGTPELTRYWSSEPLAAENAGAGAAPGEFQELLLDSVRLRLVAADVPVGIFLSGGLDSSAIAAASLDLGYRKLHTFSVGFDDAESELGYARIAAAHVQSVHHEVLLRENEFRGLLEQAVLAADEPLADLTTAPVLALARLAREHVKVVLSGEGADEILAGYDLDESSRRWMRARRLQSLPGPLLTFAARAATIASLPQNLQSRIRKLAHLPVSEWNRIEMPFISLIWAEGEKRLLWPQAQAEDSLRLLRAEYAAAPSADPLQQLLSVYQKSWLVEDLLMRSDKMTMAASLELRTPFLDYRIVEWANRQPNSVKIAPGPHRNLETKAVLRQFCRTRLPAEIISRPKRGFPLPAFRWLREGLRGWTEDLLFGPQARCLAAFARPPMERQFALALSGDRGACARVWNLIILELWLRAQDAGLGESPVHARTEVGSSAAGA